MKAIKFLFFFLFCFKSFPQTITQALDPTFGNAGIVTMPGWGKSAAGIKVLYDGKILILVNIDNSIKFIRLLPDGSIDNTYNSEPVVIAGTTKIVEDMISQSDGKMVVEIQTSTTNVLVRFNAEGTIDTSFGINGYVSNCFQTMLSSYSKLGFDQITGNIYVLGYYSTASIPYNVIVECYTSTGVLNTTFNGTGFKSWTSSTGYQLKLNGIKVDSVGKIILVGYKGYPSYVGDPSAMDSWMLRLNSDGSMDTTFSGDGEFAVRQGSFYNENFDYSNSVFLKGDGSIVVAGSRGTYFSDHKFMIYEVSNSGVLSSASMPISYTHPGTWENRGYELVVDNNGKYIIGGSVQQSAIEGNFGMLRVGSNYIADSTFEINGWISSFNQNYNCGLRKLAVQTDNKILVLGFTKIPLYSTIHPNIQIARYLETSTLKTEDFERTNQIVIYPNPAETSLTINVNDVSLINNPFEIVDLNGRILDNGILSNTTSEVNIEKLSKGIYFLKFEKQNLVQKFIKK